MSVLHHRLVMAGVITAAVIAVPAAALASASGSPSGKSASPQASAAGAARSKAGHAGAAGSKAGHAGAAEAALAASAGISPARLQAGLIAAKRAGRITAGIAAFAAATGTSHATAQRIMHAMLGAQAGHSLIAASSVRVLATRLGVSTSAAHRALQRVGALSGSHGIDPSSPAFAAIARDLGVSPAKLIAALGAVKQSMAPR